MTSDMVLIDIRTCELTLSQVMRQIGAWRKVLGPRYEIFMDGDLYAIVARKKGV